MVVVIVAMEKATGHVAGRPEVVSRGFVDMDESDDLIERTRDTVLHALESADHIVEWSAVHTQVKESVAKFLYDETHRRPMVLPVAVEV
jgi:ribonuclease J